eukprot:NODE_3138_length_2086_cov_4.036753.p1 GENE.NODE_3138_length_2086_cov_4.036753~~NODE_3138_length_2086_cov_4.036753.p1  ORF type:complete len:492 (-),score=168.38 NODE_3138_length_2086_cov_4.036753:610-1986(-)
MLRLLGGTKINDGVVPPLSPSPIVGSDVLRESLERFMGLVQITIAEVQELNSFVRTYQQGRIEALERSFLTQKEMLSDVAQGRSGDDEALGSSKFTPSVLLFDEDDEESNNVAEVDLKQQAATLQREEQKLQSLIAVHGGEYNGLHDSFFRVGLLCKAQGEHAKATQNYEKALRIRTSLFGDNHESVCIVRTKLASSLHALGENDRAIKLLFQTLNARRKTLGDNHAKVGDSNFIVGLVLAATGKYDQAERFFENTVAIRKVVGKELPSLGEAHHQLGMCLSAQGQTAKALENFEEAKRIRKVCHGDKSIKVGESCYAIATMLDVSCEYKRALEHYRIALDIYVALSGTEHADVGDICNSMAAAYHSVGDRNQALEFHKRTLQIRSNNLGKTHSKVGDSHFNIAVLLSTSVDAPLAEEQAEAIDHYDDCLEIYKNHYGWEHAETRDVRMRISQLRGFA